MLKLPLSLTIAMIGLLASVGAAAAEPVQGVSLPPPVQHNPAIKKGGFCTGYPGDKLRCDHLGKVEVMEIYNRGWRVVSAYQSSSGMGTHVLMIEEQ